MMNRICLIVHSLGVGGMERVMSELANNFCQREYTEVHLVLIGKSREIVHPISDKIIVHKPAFRFNNNYRTWNTMKTLLFIRKTVKRIGPDTILSFGEMWNNLVLLATKGLPFPIFISDRSEPGKDLGNMQNFLRNSLYPGAAGYIAQTRKAAEVCKQNGWNRNIHVIGNPVRKIEIDPEVKRENIVLSVGRLIPGKHFDQLIRMFAELNAPDWKLVIVGGNAKKLHLLNELRTLVEELGENGRIQLVGEQRDVDSYYSRAKIFAFTSSSEGFPNVISEALSAGLPVVAYREATGLEELVEESFNGFLVTYGDHDNFKKKLLKLITDRQLRSIMSENANRSISKFSNQNVSSAYLNFIMQ